MKLVASAKSGLPNSTELCQIDSRMINKMHNRSLTAVAVTQRGGPRRPSPCGWERNERRRRGLGRALDLVVRPAHPRHERLDVGRLDGGATPDAEARRRGAVRANVERDALGLEEPRHLLHLVGVEVAHGEADARVGAHGGVGPREEVQPRDLLDGGLELSQVGVGAVHQALVAADALGPLESVQVVLGGQQRGRVDGVSLEDAGVELALLGHAEDLGHRPRGLVRLEALHRSGREDEHAVRALAAEALLPREGDDVELVPRHVLREDGRGGVGDGETLAVGRDLDVSGDAHARGGAVGGEDDVLVEVDLGEVGQHAVVALHVSHILELELLHDVRVPVAAEALEVHARDRLRAEQRPHGHLDRAGVRGRHDADVVVLGEAHRLEQLARAVDRAGKLVLADLGTVGAAEHRAGEAGNGVARALLARS
mmetsp:Transcript_44875/g.107681  ORF Transcript_44875/g.107681 Transcript_44875/m.107681 type:complete len:427 (+) Transcript_44875:84-1364(+)